MPDAKQLQRIFTAEAWARAAEKAAGRLAERDRDAPTHDATHAVDLKALSAIIERVVTAEMSAAQYGVARIIVGVWRCDVEPEPKRVARHAVAVELARLHRRETDKGQRKLYAEMARCLVALWPESNGLATARERLEKVAGGAA